LSNNLPDAILLKDKLSSDPFVDPSRGGHARGIEHRAQRHLDDPRIWICPNRRQSLPACAAVVVREGHHDE
jgi:hypothetical protein